MFFNQRENERYDYKISPHIRENGHDKTKKKIQKDHDTKHVYAPTEEKPIELKEQFYEKIKKNT